MALSRVYSTTGIILKRRSVGEGDKILTVLTKQYGKRRFIGKGIRKINSRRAPHLEVFSEVLLTLHKGKTLDIITDASATFLYGMLFTNLKQIEAGYVAVEAVDLLLPDGQPHEPVFFLLSHILRTIPSIPEENLGKELSHYLDALLYLLGFVREETESVTLGEAVQRLEYVAERHMKTVKLFSK